ncbi:MAG TPA: SCO family protein [Candidatus Binataceae bacterium]|nr:SCO family protein [Candidatus Binataceae bacterium]
MKSMSAAPMLAAAAFAFLIASAGCAHREAPGSYPAANRAQCLPKNLVLLDQSGKKVPLDSLRGTPVLVDFIYANCTSTCPMMTQKMAAIAKLLGPELGGKVKIVSFTIDPDHDGPAELAKYADRMGASDPGWIFLTGTPAQIAQVLAIYGLKLSHSPDGSIMHMTAAYLLGPDGRQVRQYSGLDVSAQTVVSDIDRAGSGA